MHKSGLYQVRSNLLRKHTRLNIQGVTKLSRILICVFTYLGLQEIPGKGCEESITKLSNRASVCKNVVVLQDNFASTLDESKWTLEQYMPGYPVSMNCLCMLLVNQLVTFQEALDH